jgi:ubiquinone/menaquinone biosynthesis C-methylase UbiE
VGIDLSKGLLAEAKRLHPEVATRLMDMRKLDFADEAFDGVWAHASLLHLKRKDVTKALGEFFRVLKHNGVCFVKVKRGEGQLLVDDGNTGGKKRLMTYFELDELTMIVKRAGFVIEQAQIHNSYKMGTSKRDIDWVVVLGRKLS